MEEKIRSSNSRVIQDEEMEEDDEIVQEFNVCILF
jgi:hypothetical protein